MGALTRKGLCTGHDDLGPHLDGPGNGTELKLLELHGLHNGGGSGGGPLNDIGPEPIPSDGPGPGPGP